MHVNGFCTAMPSSTVLEIYLVPVIGPSSVKLSLITNYGIDASAIAKHWNNDKAMDHAILEIKHLIIQYLTRHGNGLQTYTRKDKTVYIERDHDSEMVTLPAVTLNVAQYFQGEKLKEYTLMREFGVLLENGHQLFCE